MLSYILNFKSALSVLMVVGLLNFTGCSENPERSAQKQAAKAVSTALQTYQRTGSFEEAQKAIQQLEPDAAGQDVAVFLKAGFSYTKASDLQSELPKAQQSLEKLLSQLDVTLSDVNNLQTEKAELTASINSHKEALASLTMQLKGTDGQPGLNDQAHELENDLARLNDQKAGFDKQAKEAQDQANKLRKESNELLRKAETAQSPEKEQLQKQAYALLSGTDTTLSQAKILAQSQDYADQSALVQSKINEVAPKLKYIQGAIAVAEQKLNELESATLITDAQGRITQIDSQIAQLEQQAQGQLADIQQTQAACEKTFTDIAALYESARKGFASASGETMDQLSKIAKADTAFRQGLVTSDYALSLNNLSARLAILPPSPGLGESINSKTQALGTVAAEMIAKAIEDYNDAANTYDRVRGRQELGKAIKTAQLLALDQMAQLARTAEMEAVANDAFARAKELINEQIESDRSFLDTPPAKLYYKLSGTTPPAPPAVTDANAPAEALPAEDANAPQVQSAPEANSADVNTTAEETTDTPNI